MKMGSESNSSVSASPCPSGKRSRDPEDEVYLDNLHSHKRYLSEIMASSLNGLTVGDPLPDNLMDSPARSDNLFYLRDDMSIQYSPMSEDSDDSRYCDTMSLKTSQPESLQTSPVSPYRYQRGLSGFPYAPSTTTYNSSHSSSLQNVISSQPRHRNSDSEGRFPSSPSDICHSADLRRAALLRSVQMRTHPLASSPFELPFTAGQESVHGIEENEERPCSFLKSLIDGRDYHIEECSLYSISEPECKSGKSGTVVNMKVDEPTHDIETEEQPCSFMKSQVGERDYQSEECSSFSVSEADFIDQEKSCVMKDESG